MSLHSVLLRTPSLAAATHFYRALGLPLVAMQASAGWARLSLGGGGGAGPSLMLQEAPPAPAPAVSAASAAASAAAPVLQFLVPAAVDFDALLPALLAAGAALEGPVLYAPAGRLAVLRAPADAGGHTLSLRSSEAEGLA